MAENKGDEKVLMKINELSGAIEKQLTVYTTAVENGLEESEKKIGKEACSRLKKASPRDSKKGGGKYAKGWTVKQNKEKHKGGVVVKNKRPGLTHLNEKGHQMRQGGRARAQPHIAPVTEWAIGEFQKDTEGILKECCK